MRRTFGATAGAPPLSRLAGLFACLTVLLLAAAASFNGFYDKWAFRDGMPRYSVERMLDDEADRPFVYRQLNIWLTNEIAASTPAAVKLMAQRFVVFTTAEAQPRLGPDRIATADVDWFWRYTVLYYLTFAEWFGAVVMLAALCGRYTGAAAGVGAAAIFALLFPVLLSQGGYFYDFPEMLFFAAAAYAAARGWIIPLAAIALVGVTNKETMVFFLPTLLPFLSARIGGLKALASLAGITIVTAAAYMLVSRQFAGNPGGAFELHLMNNIHYYADLRNLLAYEETYGLPLFRAYSGFWIAFLLVVAAAGWRAAPKLVRGHVTLALMVNLPLFAALAYRAEVRNLSLTFVGWTLLAACALRAWMRDPRNGEPRLAADAR